MIVTRPYFFWLLLLLVPLSVLAIRKHILGKRDFITLAGVWRKKEAGRLYTIKSILAVFWSAGVFIFSVIALSGVQAGERRVNDDREGKAVIIALDISNSMLCEDVAPSRLAVSVRTIEKLVYAMNDTSFGLVIFKGKAVNVWPLSEDVESIRLFLDSVKTGFITSPGTNIGAAVDTSIDAFTASGRFNSIVMFTDGENLGGDPLGAAARAAKRNIPLIPVIVGTEKGGLVPSEAGGFIKDDAGKPVVSRADETGLSELARITGGRLLTPGPAKDMANNIRDIATGGKEASMSEGSRTVKNELYPVFLSGALVFLAAWFITRGMRWKNLL